ncbi:DUF3168 domain-containing protein [Phyllobacterium sp. SYP-B3895]|uniref:DUF3168 domain-containing protein n=1 Tax=Phyllobacterium sp. SYP-B3895 TaxID=2663240 RepID=UPI0012999579|nr:DUF3168 domain-containing protein [Phyllobacterium sp. SYP-B3895]MRG53994.1 DUF3168 domain-containing protein [Phyllobacterium sp. SYP-B3895]
MTSPILELQGAIVARLKADATVSALIGQRIYDAVPATPTFPYVSFGPADEISDDVDCVTGFEITMQIDCWSRSSGFPEVKRISDAVRAALIGTDLTIADNALVYFRHNITRVFRNPDGLTSHAAISFQAFAEQP